MIAHKEIAMAAKKNRNPTVVKTPIPNKLIFAATALAPNRKLRKRENRAALRGSSLLCVVSSLLPTPVDIEIPFVFRWRLCSSYDGRVMFIGRTPEKHSGYLPCLPFITYSGINCHIPAMFPGNQSRPIGLVPKSCTLYHNIRPGKWIPISLLIDGTGI